MVEDAMRGFRDGLKEGGLAEGRDFTLKTLSAQGDMATLGSLFDSAQTAGTDLYVVFSTPTLQTALRKVHDTPLSCSRWWPIRLWSAPASPIRTTCRT